MYLHPTLTVILLGAFGAISAESGKTAELPAWCVLVCHFRPNHDHHPDGGQLDVGDIPADLCTHLVYESAVVDADFKAKPRNPMQEVYPSGKRLYDWVNKLKQRYASLSTLLALDFPTYEEFQESLSFHRSRAILIDSIVSLLSAYNFDGVVLNLPDRSQLSRNYVNLVRELAEKRSDRSFLEKAVPRWMVGSVRRHRSRRMGKLLADISRYLDMLILASDENNGTYVAYGVDPIGKPADATMDNSVASTVHALAEQGMPISKLILGLSLRPHVFVLRNSAYDQVGAPTTFDSPRLTTYPEVCKYNEQIKADEYSLVKYGRLGVGRWISYNDEEMISLKTEWLQDRGLRGLSVSLINCDDVKADCKSRKGSFPLLRTAFDNLHCLDLSMPMYESVAWSTGDPVKEKVVEAPCVRLCSINHTRVRPEHDLTPILRGGCTHLVVGSASLDRNGNLEVNDPLKEVIRTWKLIKSKTTALLLTIDGNSLAGVESFEDEKNMLERTNKAMDQLGVEGVSINLDHRQGRLPVGVDHLVERLSSKLHKIRDFGDGLRKLLVITTTVDTLYARQVDWIRLSKFADYLSISGTMDMMLGEDFNQLIRDYYIDRHKLLLGMDAPATTKYHYEEESPESTEEMCRRLTEPSDNAIALSGSPAIATHDTISSVRRKARLATMKNFGGVSLSNLESDDPMGQCFLGSKFPMLHTVMDNQLCGSDCDPAGCRSAWRVQCYYEPDTEGIRRFINPKLLSRCSHLAVVGFQLTVRGYGQLTLDVSDNVEDLFDELQTVRTESNVSLIAVVRTSPLAQELNELLEYGNNKEAVIEEIGNMIARLRFDGVELHIGALFTTNRHDNITAMLRRLKQRLNDLSGYRDYPYEINYATESGMVQTGRAGTIEEMNNIFDYVTLMSFKHKLPTFSVPQSDLMNRLSIDETIDRVVQAGIPKSKIILALPFFGTKYELLPNAKSPVDSDEEFQLNRHLKLYKASGYQTIRQICSGIVNKRMRKGLCLDRIIAYAFNRDELLLHESPETILLKARYARMKKLRGIALYTLNMDDRSVTCTGEPCPLLTAATLDVK